jgi:tetratricopeptide (TPR) repeat protein
VTYAVARLDEIEEIDDRGREWRRLRIHFGITAFGVNAWTAREPGDTVINEHDEDEPDAHEELYLVLKGHATFEIADERLDAPAGTLVFVRPGVRRSAVAAEPATTVVALGGTPGHANEVFGWEIWAPMQPLYEAGRYAEAADRATDLAVANPDVPGLLYNLACCESLAGRTDSAIEHLSRAIEIAERCRPYAHGDADFDPIRDDSRFVALVGPRRNSS